jgi:hypothetical protein
MQKTLTVWNSHGKSSETIWAHGLPLRSLKFSLTFLKLSIEVKLTPFDLQHKRTQVSLDLQMFSAEFEAWFNARH